MSSSNTSRKTQARSERFKEAAREHGCDESEERFDEALRKIGKVKPLPEGKRKPKKEKPGR